MITPADLRVDYDPEPVGLDNPTPAFFWKPVGEGRDRRQGGYRILVASSPDTLNEPDIWDSGEVDSAENAGIPYAGLELTSATEYWWTVQLREEEGRLSPPAAPARFVTGLLQPGQWQAKWIGTGPPDEPRLDVSTHMDADSVTEQFPELRLDETSVLLRREFESPSPVRRAFVFVCGLGYYVLHLNGRRVGSAVLNPAKTDYRKRVLYDTYDVTEQIRRGDNALGLVLGNGWFSPRRKWWSWRMQWHGTKRAICQLHLEHEDGSTALVASDGSWTAAPGPIREHCIYDGEAYDARREQPGWNLPGFDDSDWRPANEVPEPGGKLQSQSLEPMRIVQTRRPLAMWECEPGTWIFDMGQNFSGWCRLRVSGPGGAEVKLRHAENVTEDGALGDWTNGRALNTDTYILKGQGSEVYEPSFTYHGFQYVELTGYPGVPTLDSLDGRVISSDCRRTGEFRCASELINHIHHCTVWSQRSNMVGLPTDNNMRDERLGWAGDAHVTAEEAMCNFETPRFYRKWLRDLKLGQDAETGDVPYISPRGDVNGTPCWSSAYPLIVWYFYEHYGDRRILEEHLDHLARYVDFLGTTADAYILPCDRYGDHCTVIDGWQRGEPDLATTFFYYWNTLIVCRAAAVLGREEVRSRYEQLAETIRAAYVERYVDVEKQLCGRGSECELAMTLKLGLAPEALTDGLFGKLAHKISWWKHNHLDTGILGSKYLLEVLTDLGRPDIAWALASQSSFPSWGYMTQGYTTLSELWNSGGTNNHVMFGDVDRWFYQVLGGIRPVADAPGYRRVRIEPFIPADLDWVRAGIDTVRGRVACAWAKSAGVLRLDVRIPVGSTACVLLPARNIPDGVIVEGETTLWENGRMAAAVEGVHDIREEADRLMIETGSGDYRFNCRWVDLPHE